MPKWIKLVLAWDYVGYRVRILYRKGSRSASGKEDCWSWKSFWLMVLLSQNFEMESLCLLLRFVIRYWNFWCIITGSSSPSACY